MTQTPSRDWQKDMEMFEEANSRGVSLLIGKSAAAAGMHWLQAYAAEANEVCYWKGEAEAEKARADAAEAREQRLKVAIECAIEEYGLWKDKGRAVEVMITELKRELSTLYSNNPS